MKAPSEVGFGVDGVEGEGEGEEEENQPIVFFFGCL